MNPNRMSFRSIAKTTSLDPIVNNMPTSYCRCSKGGKILTVNLSFIKLLGYKSKKEAMSSYVPLEFKRQIHLFRKGKKTEEILKIEKKNGHKIWVEFQIKLNRDKEKNIFKYDIFINDITKYKQAKRKLSFSELNYKNLAESLEQVIYRADPITLQANYVNSAIKNIYGYTKKEWLDDSELWARAIHTDDKERVLESLDRLIDGVETIEIEYRIIDKSGIIHWVVDHVSLEKDKSGRVISMNGILVDITVIKETEEKLRNTTEYLDTILLHLPVGVAILKGPEFRYYRINEKLAELNGLPIEAHLGRPLEEVLPGSKQKLIPTMKKILKSGKPVLDREFSITLPKDLDEPVYLINHLFPISDKFGKPNSIGAVVIDITERRKSEKEVQRLALAAATVGDAICVTDNEGIIEFVNSSLNQMLGYKEDELLGKPVSSLYPGGLKNQSLKQILKTLQKKNWSGEVVLEHKNGDLIPTLETASPLIENGQVRGFVCTNTDITKLKLKEDEIKQYSIQLELRAQALIEEIEEHKNTSKKLVTQKIYFEKLFQSSPDAIAILDTSDRIIQVNKSFETIFGYRKNEVKGKKVSDLIVPDGLKRESKRYTKETAKGRTVKFESMRQTKGGDKIHVSIVSSPLIFDKNQLAVYTIYRDISTRKRALMKLQESEDRYRSYYTKTRAMLYSINIKGEIIAVSNYWLQKLGYKRSEVIGHKSVDFLTEESKRYAMNVTLPIFMKKGYANDVSYQFVKRNGKIMDTLLSAVVEYDPKGKFKRSIAVLNDVTERKQAEDILNQSRQQLRHLLQKLESIREEERTEIARDIHDDLGGSLTTLKLEISNIAKSTEDKDLIRKTDSISALVDSTITTVQKVAARLRPGILDDWGLIAAMEWALNEFQTRTENKCKFKYDDIDIPQDSELSTILFRIFQELLTNIIRHAKASKVKVQLRVKDDILTLKVTDNGIGISEKDKKDTKSFGILGISERLIPLNGKFEIIGKKRGGTEATVILPLINRNVK